MPSTLILSKDIFGKPILLVNARNLEIYKRNICSKNAREKLLGPERLVKQI